MTDTREIIDGFRAVQELMLLFKEAREKAQPIQELFIRAMEENNPKLLVEAIAAVGDLDLDHAHGALIVLMGVLAKVRAGLQGTECHDRVKALFATPEA